MTRDAHFQLNRFIISLPNSDYKKMTDSNKLIHLFPDLLDGPSREVSPLLAQGLHGADVCSLEDSFKPGNRFLLAVLQSPAL